MTLTEPRDWTSENRKILQGFLESPTGQLTLSWLAAHTPELLDGADNGRTLVASGVVKGYNKAITELLALTREQPTEILPPTNYPDLENEALWDGTSPTQ